MNREILDINSRDSNSYKLSSSFTEALGDTLSMQSDTDWPINPGRWQQEMALITNMRIEKILKAFRKMVLNRL